MRTRAGFTLALLTSVLLAGCATVSPASPQSSPGAIESSPPSAEAPTSTPAPRVEPARLFDGECERMLAPATLGSFLGDGWQVYEQWLTEQYADYPDRVDPAPEGTLGGLECRWKAPDDSASGLFDLRVLALPSDAVPADFAEAFGTPTCGWQYDALICRLLRVEDDVAILAATLSESEADTHAEALSEAIDVVAASARQQTVTAEPVDRSDEWWMGPACDAMGERIADLTGGTFVAGYWEGVESPENGFFRTAGVSQECPWFSENESQPAGEPFRIFSVTTYPGGHWMWADLVEGATSVEVSGAVAAATFSDREDEAGSIYATDGVNILHVSGEDLGFNVDVAERVLALAGS